MSRGHSVATRHTFDGHDDGDRSLLSGKPLPSHFSPPTLGFCSLSVPLTRHDRVGGPRSGVTACRMDILGPLLRWVPGPLLGGPLELLNLCYTTSVGVERKDYRGIVLDWEATHVRIHVKYS
jgi:hypothetical protein